MHNTVTFYTFIALVIFFVSIEIYRAKFFIKGIIVEFSTPELAIETFVLSRMKVQLQNGRVVEAEASQCTMCMGNLQIGDEVSLTKKDGRYIINLPFKFKNNSVTQGYCYHK